MSAVIDETKIGIRDEVIEHMMALGGIDINADMLVPVFNNRGFDVIAGALRNMCRDQVIDRSRVVEGQPPYYSLPTSTIKKIKNTPAKKGDSAQQTTSEAWESAPASKRGRKSRAERLCIELGEIKQRLATPEIENIPMKMDLLEKLAGLAGAEVGAVLIEIRNDLSRF